MPKYRAPLRDMKFVLNELFDSQEIQKLARYTDVNDELVDMVLSQMAKFAETELFPLNQVGDKEGCSLSNGVVSTPKGFKEAYAKAVNDGWVNPFAETEHGGQGLPLALLSSVNEMLTASNLSFATYFLGNAVYHALTLHANDSIKARYLPNLGTGFWAGTMNLTEPQCGTDLGLTRAKAELQPDGSYAITGTKIFITSGEHDVAENIIHMVLARTPDAPAGVKGISLFVVPKFALRDDGSLGERNGVSCDAIEHKMGIKGSSTCVMSFDNANGHLVGELNKGLRHMFTMMNEARLIVGIQGLGLSEVSYQNALAYARDRLQGRALTGAKFPDKPADPLMVHPDIRRMLLTSKAFTEGNRMLASWVSRKLDLSEYAKEEQDRQDADDFVQLMTPIVKAFITDCAQECTSNALQVFGGYGYIQDYGMEQYVRDARITPIYEGTNGIQALDLVGRKLSIGYGRLLQQFAGPVSALIADNEKNPECAEWIEPLAKAFERLQEATGYIALKAPTNHDEAGAVATDYLALFGYTALAYLWARAAILAQGKLKTSEDIFYRSKVETARFYMTKLLPRTNGILATLMSGAAPVMTMKDEAFGPFD
jgi:alkylation response protein AidB-like acyl-CoA dehydrogenase